MIGNFAGLLKNMGSNVESDLHPIRLDSLEISDSSQKMLIFPVAIIGAGKSTLAKILMQISPVTIGHVQSDNMPRSNTANHFLKAVMDSFKVHRIVYADKNNHLSIHRAKLATAFRQKYTNGIVIALDWQVERHDQTQTLEFCKKRVIAR